MNVQQKRKSRTSNKQRCRSKAYRSKAHRSKAASVSSEEGATLQMRGEQVMSKILTGELRSWTDNTFFGIRKDENVDLNLLWGLQLGFKVRYLYSAGLNIYLFFFLSLLQLSCFLQTLDPSHILTSVILNSNSIFFSLCWTIRDKKRAQPVYFTLNRRSSLLKGSKTLFILRGEIVSDINHWKAEKEKVINSVVSLLLLAIWPSAAVVWSGWVVWKLQAALWHWKSQPSVLWKSLLTHSKF